MAANMRREILNIAIGSVLLWATTVFAQGTAPGGKQPEKVDTLSLASAEQTPASPESSAEKEKKYTEHRLAEDPVTRRQSVDTFTTLEDGQPGAPGEIQMQLDAGWETRSGQPDEFTLRPELQWTPANGEFWRNLQLTLAVPMDLGNGAVDGNADLEFGWQQRWVKEEGLMPTLATLAEMRIPSGYHSAGVDGRLTGVVAKDFGPGTLYLNVWMETVNGNNFDIGEETTFLGITREGEGIRHFRWGSRLGYKWRINDTFSLVGDIRNESSEQKGVGDIDAIDLSAEWHVTEQLTIGPGIIIGLDGHDETPKFGAGVRFVYAF